MEGKNIPLCSRWAESQTQKSTIFKCISVVQVLSLYKFTVTIVILDKNNEKHDQSAGKDNK